MKNNSCTTWFLSFFDQLINLTQIVEILVPDDTNFVCLSIFQLFLQRYRAAAKAEIAGSDDEEEIDEDFEAHAGLEWVEGVTVETEGSDGLTEEEIKKSVRKGKGFPKRMFMGFFHEMSQGYLDEDNL